MEIYLPRSEILRLVRAHLGVQTTSDLGSQVAEQHVATVRAAALKVQQECRWVNPVAQTTVDLQAEQNTLNYPEDSGPGSIVSMAVYEKFSVAGSGESGQYHRLRSHRLQAQFAQDQQEISGNGEFKSVQGRPQLYDQQSQIKLWPFSDKPYKIRIEFQRRNNLPDDDSVSIVDAQLIVLWSASMLARQMGDAIQADLFGVMYADRLRSLQAWQSSGTSFAMNSEADLAEGEYFQDEVPNWDRQPTRPNV